MNLQLYFRVGWRFKWLVGGGFLLAIGLAFLSMARVDVAHGFKVSYRSPVIYQSEAILLVSQPGFPWGRATPTVGLGVDANKPDPAGAVASQNRLTSIAVLYAQMANSDPVQRLLAKSGPAVKRKDINAAPVVQAFSSVGPLLPLISITGNGPSKAIAESYARREVKAFLQYLADEQQTAKIPDAQRVVVQVLNEAQPAKVVQGRKKTMSILVFLTMMIAVWGLAFMLDNLRSGGRRDDAADGDVDAPPAVAPPRVVGLRTRSEDVPEPEAPPARPHAPSGPAAGRPHRTRREVGGRRRSRSFGDEADVGPRAAEPVADDPDLQRVVERASTAIVRTWQVADVLGLGLAPTRRLRGVRHVALGTAVFAVMAALGRPQAADDDA